MMRHLPDDSLLYVLMFVFLQFLQFFCELQFARVCFSSD